MKQEIMIEELQKRYTNAEKINSSLMNIIKKHGLTKELE